MLEIAMALVFISLTCLGYYWGGTWLLRSKTIKTRLQRLKPAVSLGNPGVMDLERPLLLRLFGPLLRRLSGLVVKFTPQNMRVQSEQLLESAGVLGNLKVNDYLAVKMLVVIGFPVLVYLSVGAANLQTGLAIIMAAFLLALIMPDFILKRMVNARQQNIQGSLPDNLDLLMVSVEAGLGFDQALLKLAEKTKGPLTDEFKRVLHEIRIGKTRRDALREMSVRTGVEDLQNFVVAIIQADQLGVSIGNVLRIQAQQLRQKRRLKAEERAQKAPIKMLIPMIIFIFPCLFIILLGPGILQLIDNFVTMKR